jgi:hypothetical protein
MNALSESALRARIRAWTAILIAGLFLSGITAIPLRAELAALTPVFGTASPLGSWLLRIQAAVDVVATRYPFLFLGTDWLAFGHIVIGLGFIGLLIDPLRNEWLITWGMIACALVIPWAWIFGAARDIPWWWRCVDSSFGVGGILPLLLIRAYVNELKHRRDMGVTG